MCSGRTISRLWDKHAIGLFQPAFLKSSQQRRYRQSHPSIACWNCARPSPFDPAEVVGIEADVFQYAYDFTGGGSSGRRPTFTRRKTPITVFPIFLAVAALDGDVQLAQLDPKRIEKSDVQELLLKVEVRPDSRFTGSLSGPTRKPCYSPPKER